MVIAAGKTKSKGGRAVDPVSRTGLRRVDWVRVIISDEQIRAEAVGAGFRLPVTCPVSLPLAAELIASGIPYVTCPFNHMSAGI